MPTPPAASPSPSVTPEVLVIEEPAPPQSEQAAPSEQPAPETTPARRRHRAAPPSVVTPFEVVPEEQPVPAEAPALEARETPRQQVALRSQIQGLLESLRQRLGRLESLRLMARDRRAREDAHTFLTQSQQALEQGDLQRALNLAQKAELLVADLERQR